MKGKLVIVDGMDGAGKSSALKGLIEWAVENNKKTFDLRKFEKDSGRIANFENFKEADVIISAEPTLSGVGKVIKEILIKKNGYSGISIAQAFAIDREIHYNRVVIPALEAGKLVFQERGITTSFVYQPVQIHISLRELMSLPGNKLALKYPPSVIFICLAEPEYLTARNDGKQIFEEVNYVRNLYNRYKSEWLQGIFSNSLFKFIQTNPPKTEEDTKNEAKDAWQQLIT